MKAMVLREIGSIDDSPLKLEDMPIPEPGPQQVRIKIRCCAICRTDLHVIEGDLPEYKLPMVPGHQIIGTIDKIGRGCGHVRKGQRVGVAWLRSTCGKCEYCLSGKENLCESAMFTGYHKEGGFAEYALVRYDFAYPIPKKIDDVTAAPMLCSGLIGYRALERANVFSGCRLLLIGFGSSAHLVMQLAKNRFCEVFVVTRSEGHQELAREMGAVWVGSSCDELPDLMDSVIIFAPVGELYRDALNHLKRGGTVISAGIHMSPVPQFDYQDHMFYERDIRTVTCNTRDDGKKLIKEAAKTGLTPQVTTYPLEETNQALQDLKHDRINGTGVIVIRE
ncbi:zinc-dependent alcohol dehydrogenase family protein [Planctomycetales bacterium ZRK34]|nr:zinc-dependent alcohol dehydrogenase family protein [Planctomycetales bacterium ZRK34]